MTKRAGNVPEEGNERLTDDEQVLLKPENIRQLEIICCEDVLLVDSRPMKEWKEKPQWDLGLLVDTPLRDRCTPLQKLFDTAYQTATVPTKI